MILIEPGGWGGFPQMPMDGPFITDDNLQIPVDNTTVSGKQVREDLEVWFRNGCPKDPMPIPGP
jgi:hypothetical protein